MIEGRLHVAVLAPSAFAAGFDLLKDVRDFLRSRGDVFAFRALTQYPNPFEALVEFSDIDVAAAVASQYSCAALPNVRIVSLSVSWRAL